MLSAEIPSDLSCPFEIKSNNSDINVEEKVSDDNQHQLEVDLLKPDFVDDDNPLPQFSIRDYVSSTRCKDIRTNWPFSQKNLQLCLKHGLTEVLPPFESLDSVKNPSKNTNNEFKLSGYSNNVADLLNLPESVQERPESSLPVRNTRSSGKNCKQIVKLNKAAAPLTSEYLAGNTFGISDIMTSKVCPVCKTFTSSSNTTLNAHIDQCLSGVSAVELMSNSKVSKHRIKPRKTKLIVDIYATAQCCTLEDLDRRNGTNWSLNFGLPSQVIEVCDEDKKIDSVGWENEEGACYVDSCGTKFLSLSKFTDLPSDLNAEYYLGRKLVRRNKENKVSWSKKSKILAKKNDLSSHPRDSRLCSSRPNYCPEDNYYQRKKLVPSDPLKSDEMGMVKKHIPDKMVSKSRVEGSFSGRKFMSDSKSLDFSDERTDEESNEKESMRGVDESSSFESRGFDGKKRSQSFYRWNVKKSRTDELTVNGKRTRITKIEKRPLAKSGTEFNESSTGSETSSESCSVDVRKSADSSVRVSDSKSTSILKGVEKNEEALVASCKSFDSAIHRFSGPLQHHMKEHKRFCPDKLLSDNESEKLRFDKVLENVVITEARVVVESGKDEERGSYFVGVDPITIPGPPGSFLPSPGHISSEELQGNSSLTTCRISDMKPELVCRDAPNSPISSASMVSESAIVGSDLMHANLVEKSLGVKRQLGEAQTKLNLDESKGSFILPAASSQIFENCLPCCCSRKEGTFQNASSSSQLSLLSQWSISSLNFPVREQTYEFSFCKEILPEKERIKPIKVNEDSSSIGDSSSNPVLRLMGKDVIVSPGSRNSRSSSACDHPSPIQNVYNCDSTRSQAPPLFHCAKPEVSSSKGFSPYLSGGGAFSPILEHWDYRGKCDSANKIGYGVRTDTSVAYDVKKLPTFRLGTADFSGSQHQQVHGEAAMDARGSTFRRGAAHDSKNLNPLFSNPLYNQASSSQEINTSSIKWSCAAPKDSNPSPSTGHLGSSLFFSPGFS